MIDIPFTVYLALAGLVLCLAVAADFRRRASIAHERRKNDLSHAMDKTVIRHPPQERNST